MPLLNAGIRSTLGFSINWIRTLGVEETRLKIVSATGVMERLSKAPIDREDVPPVIWFNSVSALCSSAMIDFEQNYREMSFF